MEDLRAVLSPGDVIETYLRGEYDRINPITLEHLNRLHALFLKIKDLPTEQAVLIITDWLNLCFPEIPKTQVYQCFSDAIAGAKDFREALVREFCLLNERFPFTSDGLIRPTNDPVKLLNLCWTPLNSPHYNQARSFEAHLFWHLGMRYLLMKVKNKGIYERLPEITLWLEEHLFDQAKAIDAGKRLRIHYDPENFCRYSNDPQKPYFWHETWCRHIAVNGRQIEVLFEGREKKAEDIFRKILLKSQGGAPAITDTCAITLVFFNEQDLQETYELLKEKIFVSGDLVSNLRYNCNGKHKGNSYSSGIANPHYHFLVHFFGGPLEVQIFLIDHWINRKFSLGPENHRLYRLNQVLELLKVLMPHEIFHFDWDDSLRMAKMIALQKAVIKSTFCEITCSSPA